MERQFITFAKKQYSEQRDPSPVVTAISEMSGPELVSLHNLVADNLGQGHVRKFADLSKARTRTWAKLVEWNGFEVEGDKLVADILAPPSIPVNDSDTRIEDTGEANRFKLDLSDEDKAKVAEPKPLLSEQLLSAAAAAKAEKTPIWARPKEVAASRRAYRPRAGTQQAAAYALLTQEGGVDIHEFCERMTPLNGEGTQPWVPASTWSVLRYLFVSSKGYGLRFDGARLYLLIPADERDSVAKREDK